MKTCGSCGGMGILTIRSAAFKNVDRQTAKHLVGDICPACLGDGSVQEDGSPLPCTQPDAATPFRDEADQSELLTLPKVNGAIALVAAVACLVSVGGILSITFLTLRFIYAR